MRISELSRRTGVSVPTIKYYLREGLLPPGIATAVNQADYGDDHAHRLRLIRVLREVGELPIAQIKPILNALDDEQLTIHEVLRVPHRSLASGSTTAGEPNRSAARDAAGGAADDVVRARADVDDFLLDLGWQVAPDAPGRRTLADALVALRRLGRDVGPEVFRRYAAIADSLAEREVASLPRGGTRLDTLEEMVIGTVVFEAVLTALRRLAHEHHSSRRFATGRSGDAG